MPRIDTSAIAGYAEMTAEQKLAALEQYEIDFSGYVPKAQADKFASEAAEYRKKLSARMTEEESKEAERAENLSKMEARLAEQEKLIQQLEQDKREQQFKGKYLTMPGYDEKLAEETAKAMATGDMAKVLENQQKAMAAYEKKVKSDLLRTTPVPKGGGSGTEKPADIKFAKMLGESKAASHKESVDILKNYNM